MRVDGVDDELLRTEQAATGVNSQLAVPPFELTGDQELDVLMRHDVVAVNSFADQIGVDRHLGGLASTDWGNEVEGDLAAFAFGELDGFFGDGDLHGSHNIHGQMIVPWARRLRVRR